MTKTSTKPPPEVSAVCGPPDKDGSQVVVLGVEKDVDGYLVTPLMSDMGPSFTVTKVVGKKQGDGPYSVSLSGRGICDCKGFSFRGTCRHLRGLFSLWADGKLNTQAHAKAVLAKLG